MKSKKCAYCDGYGEILDGDTPRPCPECNDPEKEKTLGESLNPPREKGVLMENKTNQLPFTVSVSP